MEWYIPITILPAAGILILSTTNQMMTLSNEIGHLLAEKCSPFQHNIADLKLLQLKKLTRAATFLYMAAACFVLAGLISVFIENRSDIMFSNYILTIGVLFILLSLVLLVQYSYKAIKIRMLQHQHNHEL
jgi:hypothetical protein